MASFEAFDALTQRKTIQNHIENLPGTRPGIPIWNEKMPWDQVIPEVALNLCAEPCGRRSLP